MVHQWKRGPWTAHECARVRMEYPTGGDLVALSRELNRDYAAIKNCAARLGLKRERKCSWGWPAEQTATLVAEYATANIADLARKLGRSRGAVSRKACSMGLVRPLPPLPPRTTASER